MDLIWAILIAAAVFTIVGIPLHFLVRESERGLSKDEIAQRDAKAAEDLQNFSM